MSRKNSLTRNLILGLTSTALLVSTSACATPAGGTAEGGGSAPQPITIGLPVEATTLTPVYVATAEKLWEKHGLQPKILTFKGDAELVKAVLSGDVDVAVGSLAGPLQADQAGQDVEVFYGGFNMPAFSWYAVPEVKTIEDGKGKNWGVTTHGSSTDLLTRYSMAKAGIDPEKDAKIIQGGASAARLAAMEAGQLQVNIFAEPQTIIAERKGYNKILDLKDVVSSYPMHVSWGTPTYIDSHSAQVEDFVAALAEGMQVTKDQPDKSAQVLADRAKIELPDAKASIERWIDGLYPDGRMPDKDSLDAFFKMGTDGGLFTQRSPESEWLDTRFIKSEAAPSK
jgi:NitT/TauT family transport system substrate-binding protein